MVVPGRTKLPTGLACDTFGRHFGVDNLLGPKPQCWAASTLTPANVQTDLG